MTFRVGQEVVCVDASEDAYWHLPSGLIRGVVYRIRWVGFWDKWPFDHPGPGIKVEGVIRPKNDAPFRASRFRPVQKRKTDISVFTALLNTNKVREEA